MHIYICTACILCHVCRGVENTLTVVGIHTYVVLWFVVLGFFFPFFFQKGDVMCKPECLRSPHFLEIVIALFVSRILQNIAKNCTFSLQISHCFLLYICHWQNKTYPLRVLYNVYYFFFFPLFRLTTENIQAEKGKMLVSSHTDDRAC